ncbi:MAG: bifunctional diguanylate cyclase/phosphodiesterase [Eubacterium sp.]|nr:bifunctional diguanylate cyclase/phosphodiesterase [Eubacterium sp.]
MIKRICRQLGFLRNSKYETQYLNDTNIRTSIYMSVVIIALEIWMLIRYVDKRPGLTFMEYFDGWTNYLILLSSAVIILCFGIRHKIHEHDLHRKRCIPGLVTGLIFFILDILLFARFIHVRKDKLNFGDLLDEAKYLLLLTALILAYLAFELFFYKGIQRSAAIYGQFLNVIFAVICLGFGCETSISDVSKERQILCFVTMVIYAACLLIWKPYVSFIILSASFLYFYHDWEPIMKANESPYAQKILEANQINFFTFWIALLMVCISIYQQRLMEAKKDENLTKAHSIMKKLAVEDELTGLSNMHQFAQDAELIMLESPANRIYLFINVDNFKNFNDKYGYQAGNEFLKTTANIIKNGFPGDPVARQSDDHFAVLTTTDNLEEKIRNIRNQVTSLHQDIYVDLKVGSYIPNMNLSESTVLTSTPSGSTIELRAAGKVIDPHIAIDRARFACGLIKNKFDKHYMEYDEKVDKDFHKRQYIVNNIDTAVSNGYIKVYYQPVVWSDTHTLCSCEALARWIDPEYGFLSPGDFIPVLEEYRLIDKLDKCIWEMVCRDIRHIMDAGLKPIPVSLNISRLDFELMDTPSVMENLVQKYNIDKKNIHVEITESALANDMGELQSSLSRLKNDGFSMWLDDFGSGYSSLNVLKDYNFDVLKIDMKFLSNFEKNDKSKVILNTIVELATHLGMFSLTEGVETGDEADFLNHIGCGRLQGYYFGKPMPLEDIISKIKDGTYVIKRLE